MNTIGNILGEICKTILPIPEELYYGNQKSSITICTLSSMKLLKEIATSDLMKNVAVVGRLLSENKGIDSIILYVVSNKNIKTIVLCGREVSGHKAGQSLMALYKNGIDSNGRIINSLSPDPQLNVTLDQVEKFRKQIKIINKIGETNFLKIHHAVNSINN